MIGSSGQTGLTHHNAFLSGFPVHARYNDHCKRDVGVLAALVN